MARSGMTMDTKCQKHDTRQTEVVMRDEHCFPRTAADIAPRSALPVSLVWSLAH